MYISGIIETIITLPIGVIFIILGFLLWKKQKIKLIHEYHHTNVKSQDIKAYTSLWGIALIILGACIFPVGIIDFIFHTWLGWILFGIGFIVCFIIGNKGKKHITVRGSALIENYIN